MAFTAEIQLILIIAISGLIAIGIYTLYLVDKLHSRIVRLEEALQEEKSENLKFGADPEKVKVLSERLAATEEILHSTGKDIDSINSKMESLNFGLSDITRRIGVVGHDSSESRDKIISIQSDISNLSKRLEQIEREASKLIWAETDDF